MAECHLGQIFEIVILLTYKNVGGGGGFHFGVVHTQYGECRYSQVAMYVAFVGLSCSAETTGEGQRYIVDWVTLIRLCQLECLLN